MLLPTEIYDSITFYVEISNFGSDEETDYRRYKIRDYECRQRLATLRLVSKEFCYSASPRLFRHIIATAQPSNQLPLVGLLELSNSPYAIYVHQIDLGFDPRFKYTCKAQLEYAEDLAGLLSSCLVRFPSLSSLQFHTPPGDLGLNTSIFINTTVEVLRYVPLLNLTELDVTFPVTYDFGRFFPSDTSTSILRIPIERVLQRLGHLSLSVIEYTDQPGPFLPEYATFPNENYAAHLFRLVELATNLNSLKICCTDTIELDNFQLGHLIHLKSLYLHRVSVSPHTLLSILGQSSESLTSIQLSHVQLNSGTWQHVLLQIIRLLPHLLDFIIRSSGYSLVGSSSNLADTYLRTPAEPEDIETLNFLDILALGNLQRQVNAHRANAGRNQFSPCRYRHIQREPIEVVLGQLGLRIDRD